VVVRQPQATAHASSEIGPGLRASILAYRWLGAAFNAPSIAGPRPKLLLIDEPSSESASDSSAARSTRPTAGRRRGGNQYHAVTLTPTKARSKSSFCNSLPEASSTVSSPPATAPTYTFSVYALAKVFDQSNDGATPTLQPSRSTKENGSEKP
jgi:hypothetical protein